MPSSQLVIVSALTGIFISTGWWLFIDGAITSPDAFPWFHIVPAFGITVAMFCVNLVSISQLDDYEHSGSVKTWLFFWFMVAFVCVGIAIWITSTEYPPNYNWPGVAIILHTLCTFTAGAIYLIGRKHTSTSFGRA